MIDIEPAVTAEAKALAAEIERQMSSEPAPHTLPIAAQRAAMGEGAEPPMAGAIDTAIGGVPVRILEPAEARGTYLHIHGGGWTMGSNAWQDQRLWQLACDVRVRVISVEYRLAPEHPFPAGLDDCLVVADEVAGPNSCIGGESAGAHLSALVLSRLGGGFGGANLSYGCFDLGMTASQRRWGSRQLIISTPGTRWHIDQLLPHLDEAARRDPSISPLFADLTAMPPALFTIGTDDPMLDDSVEIAARWAGSELDVYPGGFHAFDLFPIRMAQLARQRQHDFLRRRFESA